MKNVLLVLICFISATCVAQFSKTHYIPPLSSGEVFPEDQYLYISTPSLTPVTFRIINLGGGITEGTVSRDLPYVHGIGAGFSSQLMVPSNSTNEVLSNKGFIVEAENLVYVTVRLMASMGNHAGVVVSKGLAALGTEFRIGALTNTSAPGYSASHYTFVSVLATENNTTVTFSDIKDGAELVFNEFEGNTPQTVVLNSGESYVIAVQGPHEANRDALIGSLVTSDKPIAVNCGSFAGTNGEMANIDLGFDQIVSAERTGKEYIFIKSTGLDAVERVLLVSNADDTEVFVNGNATPTFTIDAGEYVSLGGGFFTANDNLYIRTSKDVFAYQSVGDNGRPDQANQEMFFVPPLSCETPKIIDNIPFMNEIGLNSFNGRVTLVTETGSTLNFVIDGTDYTLAGLPGGVSVNGPLTVTGNPGFVTYTLTGLSGNVSVISTTQLYLASYGSFDAATFGGFYSGFTFKPAISFEQIDISQPNCLPNIQLSVNEVTGFDSFEWYFNDILISAATSINPTLPGYYYVKATISECGTTLNSDVIPVSSCVTDQDLDGVNDNVDLDNDNDGIYNCDESYGDLGINLSNPASGSFSVGSYSNSFTGSFPPASGPPAAVPFIGYANGNFVTETSPGVGNSTIYKATFAQPVSIAVEYVETANPADLLNADAEFVISSPVTTTISVLNPTNQLLIDTNYDGIYESGVTEYSSFEIRFRINSTTPLAPGSGTFRFLTSLVSSISITHKNLLDDAATNATFCLLAGCVPLDSDNDGVPDQGDLDSDNDAIPDVFESQGGIIKTLTGTDANSDGLDDVFGNGSAPADTDDDGVFDFIDFDSDNDGIFDVIESGTSAASSNGTLTSTNFGSNGMANNIQTPPGSGILNYAIADTDGDGTINASESDSDDDGCGDVREAGFSDNNNDGYLGNGATTNVNNNGVVTGAGGYTTPDNNYLVPVPILITQQASDFVACETRSAVFTVQTNDGVTYQWQRSTNGIAFTNITNNTVYSGATTSSLTISNITPAMNGNEFRVILNKAGNVCGLQGDIVTLSVNPLPIVIERDLIQCDTGSAPDGITLFNLSEADFSFIGGNPDLSIAYFENLANAEANIGIPGNVYTNSSNPQQLVARITDSTTGCFSYSTLNLVVNLLPSPVIAVEHCDDDGNEDGFYQFDLTVFSSPSTNVRYYTSENDALLEQNELSNANAFVNATPYQMQTVYARTESANDCTVIKMLNVTVHPLPDIDANIQLDPHVVCVNDTVFTTTIDAALLDGSSPAEYSYQWFYEGVAIPNSDSYTLTISTEGTYSVIVTDANGCTKVRTVPVIASSTAIIEDIEIVELSENNTVTVTVSDNSYGNYVYSLDFPNAYQNSNIFYNVLPGLHTVYVKDVNGCPVSTQQISVIGIPKYFTPNGDGFHDTWNIQGVSFVFHPNTITYIYDRYGKLLKQLSASGSGWDGTFSGQKLPADDYWYVIKMEDGRIFKGHFALKR